MGGWLFVCTDLKRRIQGAKGDNRREEEYRAENDKHDPESSGDNSAKIKVSEHGSEHDTDNAINVGHISFHN
jgi:hypothetical protein